MVVVEHVRRGPTHVALTQNHAVLQHARYSLYI